MEDQAEKAAVPLSTEIKLLLIHYHMIPFGDGIVDAQNLIVLAEHLFEEVVDPNAVVDPNLAMP